MVVEYLKYGPKWVQDYLEDTGATAYALYRLYPNVDVEQYPMLRDRTEEMTIMVSALAKKSGVTHEVKFGHEWKSYGLDVVGASHAQQFCLTYA